MGKFSWRSFEDFASEATIVSQALRNLGLNPKDKVAILAETRAEWMLTAYACFKNNITIVTIYTNLGNDGIAHALNETQVPLLICSDETLPKVRTYFCSIAKKMSHFTTYFLNLTWGNENCSSNYPFLPCLLGGCCGGQMRIGQEHSGL